MARKTNKTAHVLNLLANGTAKSEELEQDVKATPHISIIDSSTSPADPLAGLIRSSLDKEITLEDMAKVAAHPKRPEGRADGHGKTETITNSPVESLGSEQEVTPVPTPSSKEVEEVIKAEAVEKEVVVEKEIVEEKVAVDSSRIAHEEPVSEHLTQSAVKDTPVEAVSSVGDVNSVEAVTPVGVVPLAEAVTPAGTGSPVEAVTTAEAVTPVQAVTTAEAVTPVQAVNTAEAVTPVQAVTTAEAVTPIQAVTPVGTITPAETADMVVPAVSETSHETATANQPEDLSSVTPETEYKYLNIMETIIEDRLMEFMKKFDTCTCSRCVADVKALTMSNLPSKYIVCPVASVPPLVSFYKNKYNIYLITELTKACLAVINDPRH